MSFNPSGAAGLALEMWGGLVTEMPPQNLPAGASPDNQECQFRPGSVRMRGGLQKVFETPFGTETVTYGKSYVDNQKNIRNLYIDSAGNIRVENITASAGTNTIIGTTTPGSYAKSITAFGREYIAISDGLHGADVPLQYDGTNLDRVTQDGPGAPPTAANLDLPAVNMAVGGGGSSMQRAANVVTVDTATAHGLQVGNLTTIADVPASAIGGAGGPIVIDNQNLPGFATMQCVASHGLGVGMQVNIYNVQFVVVGTSISTAVRTGNVVTLTFSTAHGLSVGAQLEVDFIADATFNATFVVSEVNGMDTLSYAQDGVDATDTSGTGLGKLLWPVVDDGLTTFTVSAVPSATDFQFAFNYSNGTFPAANLSSTWNGQFFVSQVLSPVSFRYAENGPDNVTASIGTVKPTGQLAPGQHQMQVLYLTRQGAITAPSPPVKFTANGGQYLQVTNIPIGPANIVARVLAFTGALGEYFFYISNTPQASGQIVGTATQIDDNTTTSAILDFSDNTLFASIGISTMGNNLANQIVLDGALGFAFYGNRLITYGQRNRIQNLLNQGFDGGAFATSPTLPTGWQVNGSPGALAAGHYGGGWAFSGSDYIFQSFYEDAYGAPIGQATQTYKVRAWLAGTGIAVFTITSPTTFFSSVATLAGTSTTGAWVEATFITPMPGSIPADMQIRLTGSAGTTIDEISIIYATNPYLDTILYGSYVDNPEGFDGLSGKFGASDDTRKVMCTGEILAALYLITQDPSGRLHAVNQNPSTEPSGWSISQVAANCGALSAFGVTVSQADDASAGGGEEWLAWASSTGARLFGGDQPWKISQEIQADWAGDPRNIGLFPGINPAAVLTIWALNDTDARVIYFGLPIGGATAPNLIYPVDYRGLDTPAQIAAGDPVRIGAGGRLAATDYSRKWTRWNLTMNGAALMYRESGILQPVFFTGNGEFPGDATGFGNVYTLTGSVAFVDDDYGVIPFYYTTYFFPSQDQEQGLQLNYGRKMLQFLQASVAGSGSGGVKVTIYCNSLSNPWPITFTRMLFIDPAFDMEFPGGSAVSQRMAFKFEAVNL